jgi:hypothetical protein
MKFLNPSRINIKNSNFKQRHVRRKELLLNYLALLKGMFRYDVNGFASHRWIIYPVVPCAIYLMFFFRRTLPFRFCI